ncbi:hypothetical protein JCM8208_006814 [Rhodotorula glutinis]
MAPAPHDQAADDSDLDSNAPLLPAPVPSSTSPNAGASSSANPSSRSRGRIAWAWVVLGCFGVGLLWLAFGTSYLDRRDRDELWEDDPAFPSHVGYEGPTPTGKEAFAAATSYPVNFDSSPLDPPAPTRQFNILHHLGNLSPWRTVNHGLRTTAQVPAGCTVEEVQLLHRHGARYPTTGAGPAAFAKDVVGAEGFKASGNLSFLNNWEYKLGAEILTPFGREQLFNLGVSFRTKYGHLLDEGKKPVFRTESQDRMHASALNFAAGFWGIPFEDKYHQLVTIEWPAFNNTLSPYMTCTNANRLDLTRGPRKMALWMKQYLEGARVRIQEQVEGVELSHRDLFNMQLMCAYELVALGGSAFCPLFTEDEWRGFGYAHDIEFYDIFSFGQPAQAAVGKGWVQEWLARTLKQPLGEFNSTTNSTLHTSQYFPLDQRLYVDATHDTILSAVITTLGFSSFARSGPLPSDRIPDDLSFVTSSISPFAANLHSQVLSCPVDGGDSERLVRWILNDGVVPLDVIEGCGEHRDGMCRLDTFVAATQRRLASIDWAHDCLAQYDLPNEPVNDGRPPHA